MTKSVVISGSSRGLGMNISSYLLERDWNVFGISRSSSSITHEKYTHIRADISNIHNIELIREIIKDIKINALINNAAIFMRKKFCDSTFSDIDNMIDTNVKGTMYLTKLLMNNITSSGNIVFINSVAGINELEMQSIYCASKHALTAFAGVIGRELQSKNISITNIHPGGINTQLWNENNPYPGDDISKTIDPNEIAKLIEFILNKSSSIEYKTIKLFPSNEWHQ